MSVSGKPALKSWTPFWGCSAGGPPWPGSDNPFLSVIVFPARAGMKAARATLSASLPTRSPRPGSLPPAR